MLICFMSMVFLAHLLKHLKVLDTSFGMTSVFYCRSFDVPNFLLPTVKCFLYCFYDTNYVRETHKKIIKRYTNQMPSRHRNYLQ